MPDDVRFADGRTGAAGGVGARRPLPLSPCNARSTRSTRGRACCSGAAGGPVSTRSGTRGPAIRRRTSGRCACSWSRRCRPRAAASRTGRTTSAAISGHRLVERCPPELLVRWLQFGCFTPLMHAHGADAAGAVALLRARARPVSRLRAAARAARAVCPGGRCDRFADRSADHPAAVPDRSERPAGVDDRRRLRLRAGAVGGAGARRRGARARGGAAAGGLDRDVVGPAGAWRRRGRGGGAARADPGVGARRLDRRHVSGVARRARAGGRARVASVRWSRRCGGRRGWVGRPPGWPTGRGSGGGGVAWSVSAPVERDV